LSEKGFTADFPATSLFLPPFWRSTETVELALPASTKSEVRTLHFLLSALDFLFPHLWPLHSCRPRSPFPPLPCPAGHNRFWLLPASPRSKLAIRVIAVQKIPEAPSLPRPTAIPSFPPFLDRRCPKGSRHCFFGRYWLTDFKSFWGLQGFFPPSSSCPVGSSLFVGPQSLQFLFFHPIRLGSPAVESALVLVERIASPVCRLLLGRVPPLAPFPWRSTEEMDFFLLVVSFVRAIISANILPPLRKRTVFPVS